MPDHPHHREFSRAHLALTACLVIDGVSHRTERVRDVSLSGIFVEHPGLAPVGANCHVTLNWNPPDGPQVVADGKVVRSTPEGVGIAIVELIGLESLEHLQKLILYHVPNPDQVVHEFLEHDGLLRKA